LTSIKSIIIMISGAMPSDFYQKLYIFLSTEQTDKLTSNK
jgi:hypothetical protein